MEKGILINQVFSGEYLHEDENIGHEIIDFIKADNGKNYLYITRDGNVPDSRTVDSVICVCYYSEKSTAEIVAVALDVRKFEQGQIAQVKFGGATLEDIFGDETYHGKREGADNVVSFEATGGVFIPKQQLLLTVNDNEDELPGNPFVIRLDDYDHQYASLLNSSLRMYISKENDRINYERLNLLMRIPELWERIDWTFADMESRVSQPTILKRLNSETISKKMGKNPKRDEIEENYRTMVSRFALKLSNANLSV